MKKTTLFVLLTLLCLPSLGEAATYYVAKTGSNSNAGTSVGAAWLTIQKAEDTMGAGDTVTVSAGTYNERVNINTSGSSGNRITYKTNGTVITKGFAITASYITVQGFEITLTVPGWTTGSGVYVYGGQNVEVLNNFIHDVAFYGVFYDADPVDSAITSNGTIKGNTILRAVEAGMRIMGQTHMIESNDISHSREWQPGVTTFASGGDADGIRFFGTGHTFRKNYVHDIYTTDAGNYPIDHPDEPHIDAIQTWGPAYDILFEGNFFSIAENEMQGAMIERLYAPVSGLTFKNNIFVNGATGYGPGLNFRAGSGTLSNLTIVNNTFVRTNGPGQYGVRFQTGVQTVVLQNNSFYNTGNASNSYVLVESGASGITISHNAVYTTGTAPAGGAYSNDIWMVNPLFVSFAARNFHLQSTSPLIEMGATLAAVTNDYDGTARPRGAAYDIGAFEFLTCP